MFILELPCAPLFICLAWVMADFVVEIAFDVNAERDLMFITFDTPLADPTIV